MAQLYSISDLAREFGITLRALRFYEQRGLIKPARDGITRIYTEADRARIAEIMRMRKLGFTVREIKAGRFPREKYAEQLALARRQREELDEVIADLERRAA